MQIAKLALGYPEVFPACLVTQSQAKVVPNPTANHDVVATGPAVEVLKPEGPWQIRSLTNGVV